MKPRQNQIIRWGQPFARSQGESAFPDLWPDLGAWYPILGPTGEIIRDISGRNNHGYLRDPNSNFLGWPLDPDGYAIEFQGDQLAGFDLGHALSLSGSENFTLSFAALTSGDQEAMVMGEAGTSTNYVWLREGSYLRFNAAGTSLNFTSVTSFTSYQVFSLVKNASGLHLFIDGEWIQSLTSSFSALTLDTFGDGNNNSGYVLDGKIYWVHITRQPLSARQVKTLHTDPSICFKQKTVPGVISAASDPIRETQEHLEILITDGGEIRETQEHLEILLLPSSHEVEFEDSAPLGSDEIAVHLQGTFGIELEDTAPLGSDEIAVGLAQWMEVAFEDTAPLGSDEFKAPLGIQAAFEDTAPLGSDSISTQLGLFAGTEFIILVNIYLDDGVYRTSWPAAVRNNDTYWDGKILGFGSIDRSIEIPSGLTRVGDGSMTIADPDQSMREKLASYQPRGKLIDLLLVPVGGSTLTAQRIYKGEITRVDFPEGAVAFNFTDRTFRFFNESLPPLINDNNFTDLPEGEDYEAFSPIIMGTCDSSLLGDQGTVDCPQVDSDNKIFNGARHVLEEVLAVFRKQAGEEIFTEVTSGWSVTTENKTINGVAYTFTHIEFSSDQGDGTQIRIDAKGLPVIDSNGDGVHDTSSRNLALNLKRYLDLFVNEELEIDLATFNTLESTFDNLGYYCDGAIGQDMTHREVISQMVASFNVDFFQTRHGRIAVELTEDVTPERELTDDFHLLKDNLVIHTPEPICTKVNFKYGLQPSGKYFGEGSVEDTDYEDNIGEKVERVHEMPFCRDYDTAERVATHILGHLVESAHRIDFELDAPKTIDIIELADIVGITHYGGLDIGGYSNEGFKIQKVSFDPNDLRFSIAAVRPQAPPDEGGKELTGCTAPNATPGPYLIGRKIYLVLTDSQADNHKLSVHGSSVYLSGLEKKQTLTFADELRSYDSCLSADKKYIHIVTMETSTEKVEYHRFNVASNSFDLSFKEIGTCNAESYAGNYHDYGIVGINDYNRPRVSIGTATDGSVHVVFNYVTETYDPADGTFDYEESAAGNYGFMQIRYVKSTDEGNTWGTYTELSPDTASPYTCCDFAYMPGKLTRNLSNGTVGLIAVRNPGFIPSRADYTCQILYPSIGGSSVWLSTNLNHVPAGSPCGEPHEAIIDGERWILVHYDGFSIEAYVDALPIDLGVTSVGASGFMSPEMYGYDPLSGYATPIAHANINSSNTTCGGKWGSGFGGHCPLVLNETYQDTVFSADFHAHHHMDDAGNDWMPHDQDISDIHGMVFSAGGRVYLLTLFCNGSDYETRWLRLKRLDDYSDYANYANFAAWVAGEVT